MNTTPTNIQEELTITSEDLSEWLEKERNIFILDVRPAEEREEWAIPESIHADIYKALKTGHANPLSGVNVPEDRPVVTVCGAGKTSLTAARLLREKGIESYSLEGGMKAWNFAWDTAEISLDEQTQVLQIRRLAKGCLSYLIGSGDEAVVIDASLEPGVYLGLAAERGWEITCVMDTHLHADFVSRSRELARAAGVPFLLHREAQAEYSFEGLSDGQNLNVGQASITAMHTPGHTPESLSFVLNKSAVCTGDTLFTNGVGRPDLKADRRHALRKAGQLYDSLQSLLSLDAATWVLPAHTAGSVRYGAPAISAQIGKLREQMELLSLGKEDFCDRAVSRIPPTPSNYQVISEINRKGSRGDYRLEELEAGANRCAAG